MIRQKTFKDIRETLDKHSKFNFTDFTITSKGDKVTIKYEYDNSYYFESDIPSDTSNVNGFEDYRFYYKMCPGRLTLVESNRVEGERKFYEQIISWLDNLWSELISIPLIRQFENQEKIIDGIKEKLNNIPDTFFDFEEAEEIKRKIDILEKQFEAKLGKEISDKEKLKEQLDILNKEFENLKATIHSVKRKGWFKSFVAKTFVWVTKEENRKFLGETKDFIKPLLPENVSNIIP